MGQRGNRAWTFAAGVLVYGLSILVVTAAAWLVLLPSPPHPFSPTAVTFHNRTDRALHATLSNSVGSWSGGIGPGRETPVHGIASAYDRQWHIVVTDQAGTAVHGEVVSNGELSQRQWRVEITGDSACHSGQ